MAVGWGSVVDCDDMTINSTTWVVAEDGAADVELTLAANQEVHVSVEYNPQATPTDTFEFKVSTTVAATSIEWDTSPVLAFALGNTPDPGYRSFVIGGYYKMRFEGRLTGATDSSTFKISYIIATLS
jgi:hypothetical protein